MADLDFCCGCGSWLAANSGTMRQGPDGEAEIICDTCLKLEQNAEVLTHAEHDIKSGTLNEV